MQISKVYKRLYNEIRNESIDRNNIVTNRWSFASLTLTLSQTNDFLFNPRSLTTFSATIPEECPQCGT